MTHELILVAASGLVGFVLGTAFILFVRDRSGAGRAWEPENRRLTLVEADDIYRTDKQERSDDTKDHRMPVRRSDSGSGRPSEWNVTARSRIPVAMLTAQNGGRNGQTWLLRQAASTTIGRFDDCDIAINDNGVSRLHAQITHRVDAATAHEFTIFDYSSTNGTMVNGQPINAVASLQDGDRVQIGNSSFLFRRIRNA
jgi:hypothetical protein